MSLNKHRTRSAQRVNRTARIHRAKWLKTQFAESPEQKVECEEVKQALWSKFGELSLKEVGLIVRAAFPEVRREKHSSGYKYHYCGVAAKSCSDALSNAACNLSSEMLIKENENLKEKLGKANQQQNLIEQELYSTKQALQKTRQKLIGCQSKRLNKARVVSTSSPVEQEKTVFTEIHSQLLSDIPISSRNIPQHLGSGAFGICSLKRYRNIEVSVKLLKDSSYQDLLNEARVIKTLEGHPNLPILLGISPKSTKEKYIVTKFHGIDQKGITLWYALRNIKKSLHILKENNFKSICLGVARGLLYVHIKGYIHNDLKTDNVVLDFIDGQPTPVIIDFGKSCKITSAKRKLIPPEEKEEYSHVHSHIAPELVDGSYRQGFTSDIYSFGILYNNVAKCTSENGDLATVTSIYKKCTNKKPASRPNMDMIIEELK